MLFLTLLGIPVVICLIVYAFWHHEITPTELFLQIVGAALVAGISATIIYHANVDDVETLNGHVTGKHMEEVPCSHSYSCFCHTVCSGVGKKRSCHTRCKTCYTHNRGFALLRGTDFDWFLDTTLGEIYISRVDSRGVNEPPRYTKAKPLDPVAKRHTYENFIKAAPGTLLKHQGLTQKFKGKLPPYPQSIYDLHYMDRIVSVGLAPPENISYWNRELSRLNAGVAGKQANVILVLTKGLPQEYAYTLEQHWIGGKKNDIVVILGTKSAQIEWAYVMSWSKSELFKVSLRNDLLEVGSIENLHKVLGVIDTNTKKLFVRRPMHDFEYLKASITPTSGQFYVSLAIGIVFSIALSFLFSHPEVHVSITGTTKRNSSKRYPYQS